MSPPHPPLPRRDDLSPTQVALRELMILTRCYCDGEHPRLGHNCSFRPDVLTLVTNIGAVLKLCEESEQAQHDYVAAVDVRAAVLGIDADAVRRILLGNTAASPGEEGVGPVEPG